MDINELLRIYFLARNAVHRYQLDQYEDHLAAQLSKAVDQARREIIKKIEAGLPGEFQRAHAIAILDELEELTYGVRSYLGESIGQAAVEVGQESVTVQNSILSFDGVKPGFNYAQLTPEQLRQFLVETPVGGELLQGWVNRAILYEVQDRIKKDVLAGALQGEGYPALIKRIEEGFNGSRREAITLARTYVQSANVAAQKAVYSANRDMVKGVKWMATLERGYGSTGRGVCLTCAALDGKEFALDNHPQCPRHPRCLVPETPVFAPDKVAAFVAPYDGPVFEIGLSDGARFTVTPNHMFLTPQGFVRAEALCKGLNIFCAALGQRGSFGYPHNDGCPSRIDEIVESFSKSFGVSSVRMPVSSEHLHGDGRFVNGEVNVIAPNSLLRGDIKSFFLEHSKKFGLFGSHVEAGPFPPFSNFSDPLFWLWLASGSAVGGQSVSDIFRLGPRSHHETVGGQTVSNRNSVVPQYSPNGKSSDSIHVGECVLGDARNIFVDNNEFRQLCSFFNIDSRDVLDRFNAIPFEDASNRRLRNIKTLRKFFNRNSKSVKTTDIVFCKERYFSGHVYDLQTITSLYYVNGAISSNCRCILSPVLIPWRELGIPMDDLEAVARPYTIRDNLNIDEGGKRKILESGFHNGDYSTWFKGRPVHEQKAFLGPGKYDLYRQGVDIKDMIDRNGNQYTIKQILDKNPHLQKAS